MHTPTVNLSLLAIGVALQGLLGSTYGFALPEAYLEGDSETSAAASLAQKCTTISSYSYYTGVKSSWGLYFSGSNFTRDDAQWYSMPSNKEYTDPSQICTIAKQENSCADVAASYGAKQFSLSFAMDGAWDEGGPWRCQVFRKDDVSPGLFNTANNQVEYIWGWTLL
ncbi:hypothetical protein PV11_09962 [Exophiala sideris]|uniref:Ecp2 effector protein domain-containing protein n=1 Tax=Exophiala sideris TaxID=1016849 RepID=A0A0D1YBL6_9EURO|nr:hypothetical protein PV11_09962 [Exophiala sideris]